MKSQERNYVALATDLAPNIKLMKYFGLFLHTYWNESGYNGRIYSSIHLLLLLAQFFSILTNLILSAEDVNELSGNTITTLFFMHCITKNIYFAVHQNNIYR